MNLDSAILHLNQDKSLRKIISTIELEPIIPSGNVYLELLESIVSQQLSVKAASTIFQRFCALFPDDYPSPELLISMKPELLRSAGLSIQKAAYLKNVAVFGLENNLEHYPWGNLTDLEFISMLTKIKGVGQWTVEMILLFTLGRPDVFPLDDLGIQQAMVRLYALPESGKQLRQRMTELAEPWRPFRSHASRLLWRWKDIAKTPTV